MSLQRISAASSAAMCSIVLVSGVFAQAEHQVERSGDAPIAVPEEQKQALRERNRSAMHPGDPLVIVGVEQGDNEIRSRTPALQNSDRNTTKRNDEDAYRRKLALYEGGGRAMQPFVSARPIKHESAPLPKSQAASGDAPPDPKRKLLAVCIGILSSALFCAWAFKRYASLFTRAGA